MNMVAPVAAQSLAPLRVEWRPLAAWHAIVPAWRALAARALEPNIFYEPSFALAATTAFGHDLGAVLVWSPTEQLTGFYPARIERRDGMPVLVAWTHPYAPLGTPLVDRDEADAALAACLDHVASDSALPGLVLLPLLPEEGLFADALARTLTRRGAAHATFGHHRRAALVPENRAGYVEHAIGAKKRKELRRQRHRLADAGSLTVDVTTGATAIGDALRDFLALEARGWKGRAGTAAAKHDDIRCFIDGAIAALAADGQVRIDRLRMGGEAIAAAITLLSGARAWTWKIAYDETYARFSPGVQLMLDVTEALLVDGAVAHADSCATADHPMIDHLWRERLALSDRLIAVRTRPTTFALACRLEHLRRRTIAVAKAARDWMRR